MGREAIARLMALDGLTDEQITIGDLLQLAVAA